MRYRLKKLAVFLLFITLVISTPFVFGSNYVFAESHSETLTETEENLKEEIHDKLNDLNLSELESLFDSLNTVSGNSLGTNLKMYIQSILDGKSNFSFDVILGYLRDATLAYIKNILPGLVIIVIISIIFSLLKGLTSSFMTNETVNIIHYIINGIIIIIVFNLLKDCLSMTEAVVNGIGKLSNIIFPILLTLVTAIGGQTTAAIYQPTALILSNFLIKSITDIIFPIFISIIIIAIVSSLSKNIKLQKLEKTLKQFGEWFLGITFGLFLTYITAQGIVGVGIDGISMKSLKFAMSSYVPILGGYLSDGLDIVMSSLVLIKNAIGLIGIVLILLIILVPFLKILTLSFCLKICASIIEPLGTESSTLMFSLSKSLQLLIVVILGLSFILFVILMLLIYSFGVI